LQRSTSPFCCPTRFGLPCGGKVGPGGPQASAQCRKRANIGNSRCVTLHGRRTIQLRADASGGPGSAHRCLRRWRQGHQAGHDSTGLNYLHGVHLCRTPGGRLNAGGCGASACNKSGQHVLRRPSPGTACWPPKVRPSTRSSWRWQSPHRFCGLRDMTR